ncbi:protein-tyrosine phosphatase family protein [Halobacterium bonnevillei]|jgi:protein-tyrosine phosphatase|uniref:Phosphatase n=1 Tax=Halobacterium bonnevillei TaxID=2692200 RepID=A0A6B0SLT2_9EURY|nr:dual specificity protein phosphatase family protein [Halobacterium bonnevillei]MXR21456.1 phosphatase [Halobacterium bonnevillei]
MSHNSTPAVSVRPYGYVSENPVLYALPDRGLAIGNGAAGDHDALADRFDYVVSATGEPRALTTHHCPLIDGADNAWRAFESAAETTCALHEREGTLLVHCRAGISRSTTLAATAVAYDEGRSFVDALHVVLESHPDAVPHPALHQQAVQYLAAHV